MGRKKLWLGASAVIGTIAPAFAEESVTVNSVSIPGGIDIPAMIQSGVLTLGGIVAVALAAWAGWVLVKKCLHWVRKSF